MATIPKHIYRMCEQQLHRAAGPGCRGRMPEDRPLPSLLPSGIPQVIRGRGGHSDRTAKAGLQLAAENERDMWLRWVKCIEETERYFEGTPVIDMARRYYGQHVTMIAVAERMYVDKQTAYRYRDRYVTYLAMAAACDGLISLART